VSERNKINNLLRLFRCFRHNDRESQWQCCDYAESPPIKDNKHQSPAARACWAGPLRSPGTGAGCADAHALLEAPTPPGGSRKKGGGAREPGRYIQHIHSTQLFAPSKQLTFTPGFAVQTAGKTQKFQCGKYIRLRYINI
jgi:hypothetical protein